MPSECICGKSRPHFGFEDDDKPTCCSKCKLEGMIDTKNPKCSCGSRPIFGFENDKTATCCAKCKTEGMIDIKHKKCTCGSIPIFGFENDKTATCCLKCKTEGMIDIEHKKCTCGSARPIFGFENDKKATCCSKCKTEGMLNIITKKCLCGSVQPSFGFINDKKATCCSKCKTEGMLNIINKKCLCGSVQPSFGFINDKKATCCSKCKKENMIDIKQKKCKCGKNPCFGFEHDRQATCCTMCKLEGMINIRDKRCNANEQGIMCPVLANKKYDDYCTNCFRNLFPNDPRTALIRMKTKEIAVRDFINTNYEGFVHDKPLWIDNCKCVHLRSVDHRKLIKNTLLCVETDERQHKYYDKEDKKARVNDLLMIHTGPWIFIRFNPDRYKIKNVTHNPEMKSRFPKLKEELDKQILRINNDENKEFIEEIYLYYDEI